jgi:ferrochelatase
MKAGASGESGGAAVLVLAFGGPENMDEVRPFLQRVLAGRPVPNERFEAVVHHYELIGGRSPLPEITRAQVEALGTALQARSCDVPVHMAFRHSAPFIDDAVEELCQAHVSELTVLVLAAHESEASHGRYFAALDAALDKQAQQTRPKVRRALGFHRHPGFIAAHVAHIEAALADLPEAQRTRAPIVLTAHSIPVSASHPYVEQLEESMADISSALGRTSSLAYQSRSGSPRDPWLEPDVLAVLRDLAARGERAVLLCPVGFVCDHVEVLYDLDVEAKSLASELSITLVRAKAPNRHPRFIDALCDSVLGAKP